MPLTVVAMIANELNIQIGRQLEQVVIQENAEYEASLKKDKQ